MKLHLPKQLFTALLTAITLTASAIFTIGSTAWGARSEITTDTGSKVITYDGKGNTEISTGNTSASDLVIFTMDNANSNSESNNYYTGGNLTATTSANIQIGSIGTTTPDDSVGLIITNGNENNTQAYTGTVTGNGILKKIGPGKSGKIRFEGDVTGYTGNIVLGHSDTANTTFTLQFGKDDGTSAVRGSQDAGVAGTGSITFLNSYNLVVFDYEAKADDNSQTVPVYITNAITVNGGTSRVKLSGGADYTFTKAVTIHELTIDDNSSVITFNGTTNLGKAGTANHLTANITAAGAMTLHGDVTNSGTLTVNEGATLSISSAITNNGTLNLNGAVRADSIDMFQLAGYNVGENTSNGLLSQVSYILASGSGNVSVAETAKMYIGSDSDGMTIASSGSNTVYFNAATDGSTYFVFNDTNMSTVNSAFGALESGTIYIADGATLNTDSGATIDRPTKLNGSGTYDTNSSAMAANLSLGTNWSGTVILTGGARENQLTTYLTSSVSNSNSKVGLRGFTSWLGTNVTAHLVLLKETGVDYALNLNNGYSSGYQNGFKPVFVGAISGDGHIGYTFTGGNTNAEAIHEFRGNTSGWDGRFINDRNSGMPKMLVKFTSGGQVFSSDGNGGVEDKHSTSRTTVEINSTSATHFYGSLVNVKQLNIKGDTTLYGALGVTDGVAIDSSKTLTLDNGTTTYNGVITGTGNLTKAGEGDVTFGGAIGTENEFFGTLSVGSGSVNLQNTSYLTAMNITGGSATVNNGTIKGLVVTGGSVNLTGNTTIGQTGVNMTVPPNKDRTSGIYGYNGTITIGGGETSNTVTTTRVELGDINEANKGGILTVATNATLIITGNSGTAASTTSGNYGTASFLMGEWGSNSTLNVSGLVLAQNAPLLNGDKQAIININNGGVLAVKGIGRNGGNGVNLTLSDGGKLILGSDGMQSTSTLTTSLNAGTIGIYSDTTISKNLSLNSTSTGTTFDTQLYEWGEGGASISQGEKGGSLTISGVLSGNGKLVKTGAGTLTLSAANTYTGTTTIESGILALNLGQVDGENSIYRLNNTVDGNGSLRVESGTTLQNNGNLISSAIILNGGYLTVNGGQKLSADVTMENGSRLTFSNGDAINYSKGSPIDILVKTGATLDFAGTRQAFTTGSTLTLAGGQVTGTGDEYGAIDMNDYANITIKATEDSSLDATVRLRNGATIIVDVADDKTLDASGVFKNRNNTSAGGSFTKKGTGELVLSATNTYSGGTTIEAGTVTTKNASALGTGGVTMTGGELRVTDVADTNSDLSLKGMLQMNATASAKLATAGTTLNLGTTGSVKKTNADGSQYVTIASDGTNAASMTAKSANAQLVQLAQDASFTIADMTLTNTTITAATTKTRVNLNNVSASNLALATGKFTMNAAPVVGLGGTEATFNTGVSSLTAGAATLTLNLDMIGAYESTGAVSGATLTITLGVSGADFNSYTVENWQALVGFDGWLGTMLENQNATYQVTDGAAAVSEGASAPTVSYGYAAGGGGGNVGTLVITISGLNVPEPTTSTLSLLALAALAARRRRND